MICFLALLVFGILGIFSSTHRALAREAFDCVFRRVTLRKCTTGFDKKMKARIATGLLKHNQKAGSFVFRHFESLSWALTILAIASLLGTAVGVYNFVAFGNCNGPDSGAFCIYNALAGPDANVVAGPSSITGKPGFATGQLMGAASAELTVVEFGCFSCPYTKKAEPFVAQLLRDYEGRVNVLWKFFPLPMHAYSTESALAAACAAEQGKFEAFKEKLFANQLFFREQGLPVLNDLAQQVGLNKEAFATCLAEERYAQMVTETFKEGKQLGIYGTPTFFIGDEVVVGPNNYAELQSAVERALAKK